MAPPRISLVTPSLNQGRFIAATIESVLTQGYPDLEYFVQDGGSSDETRAVLERYADRVPYVVEKDGGQADALNRALARATGEVLGYLNSDDVLFPGALRAVAEAFADPAVLFVYGRALYVDENGRTLSPYLTKPDALELLPKSCFIAQPAAFFRRRVWEEVGPFDTTLHHTMDYDYWLRIAARFGRKCARYLDRELAGARIHGDAKTVAGWDRALDEIAALLKRHTGSVSLWWCVAKWDHRVDGRSQATHPHPVPWRAYPPAIAEFLRVNPPRFWWAGLRGAARGLSKRLRGR
jgi:glycosyltransferase involved in cell wall biosynthesis